MKVAESELKTFILDAGLVSRKMLDAAEQRAQQSKQSIGDVLVSEGQLSSDALRRVKSYVLGVPYIDLKQQSIPFEIISLIPEPIARTRNIIAYARTPESFEVALLDTADFGALDALQSRIGLVARARLTDEESMRQALLQYQRLLKEQFGSRIVSEAGSVAAVSDDMSSDALQAVATSTSVSRIVDSLLRHAIIQGASDVHIEHLQEHLLVRYRIDGALHDAMTLPKQAGAGIIARIKLLANLKLEEKDMPQDGRFRMETEDETVSFRVSLLPTYFGEKVVLRVLRETGEGFTLESLGFHGESLERIHTALRKKGGLIIVSGPADSGKTTTLYTLLDILNTPDASLATIEDPIEYQLKRVNQTQVSPAVGYTFANGVRSILRQDSDVVMIGDMRDRETAELALHAAQRGHLVLVGMQASSAADAVAQLVSLGVDPALIQTGLRAVVGQRLVRRLGSGKEGNPLSKGARAEIAPEKTFTNVLKTLIQEKAVPAGTTTEQLEFYTLASGQYQGRAGLFEVLTLTDALRALITEGADAESLEAEARKEGMLTLREEGLYAAARGITSLDEAAKLDSH